MTLQINSQQRLAKPTRPWLRAAAVIAVCGLGAGLPLLTPATKTSLQGFSRTAALTTLIDLPPLRLPVALENGTEIEPAQGNSGYSRLTIDNGNEVDAIVKLSDEATGQTLRLVYVRAGQSITLDNLGEGRCTLKFALGLDWDQQAKGFRRDGSFLAFSDPLEFDIERRSDGDYWKTYAVTLHRVPNGSARTEPIDESSF